MGMQSQISEKIRAMSEPNRKIEEETKEAEQRAAEGYKSEPQVEQVKPGAKKDKRKKAKSVSVKQDHEEITAPTGDMETAPEVAEAEAAGPESSTNNTGNKKDNSSALNKSLQDFEDLLSETKEEGTPKKDTVYIAPKQSGNKPENMEPEPEKPKEIKTTVKHSPRNKGYHAVYRHAVKNIDALTEDTSEKEPVYCLYEPLTGSLNELVRDVTVIGKSTETNIRINNRFVSGIHARVVKEADGYYIEDVGTTGTGSTNGTKVNGIRIAPGKEGKTRLEPGDIIILANTQIIFDVKK